MRCVNLAFDSAAVRRPIGALSGGQRQSVAFPRRAFGARILILDETDVRAWRKAGRDRARLCARAKKNAEFGVILITQQTFSMPIMVGVFFLFFFFFLGRQLGTFKKRDIPRPKLLRLMAGNIDAANGL